MSASTVDTENSTLPRKFEIKKLSLKNLKLSRKLLLTVITLILVIWLGFSYYLYTQTTKLIFNNTVSWAPVPAYGYDLEFIKNSSGENLSLWYFENNFSDRTILYLHGNAGRIADYFKELRVYGNVLSPAYPGYHESEGIPTPKKVYETAELAYNWLVEVKKIPEEKIVIFGHSLGGSPAVNLASKKPKAKKLILMNTFSSISSMCFRQYSIFCTFSSGILNSAKFAPKVEIPVRQFVYTGDKTVPPAEAKKLYDKFSNTEDKKLIELDKYTHVYFDFKEVFKLADEDFDSSQDSEFFSDFKFP